MKRILALLLAVFALVPANIACGAAHKHHKRVVTVWVNTATGVYHYPSSHWYGRTKHGKFVSETKARAEGDRPAENGQ